MSPAPNWKHASPPAGPASGLGSGVSPVREEAARRRRRGAAVAGSDVSPDPLARSGVSPGPPTLVAMPKQRAPKRDYQHERLARHATLLPDGFYTETDSWELPTSEALGAAVAAWPDDGEYPSGASVGVAPLVWDWFRSTFKWWGLPEEAILHHSVALNQLHVGEEHTVRWCTREAAAEQLARLLQGDAAG